MSGRHLAFPFRIGAAPRWRRRRGLHRGEIIQLLLTAPGDDVPADLWRRPARLVFSATTTSPPP
jgi:hypothetical protein